MGPVSVLSMAYDSILCPAFVFMPDGQIVNFKNYISPSNVKEVHLIPGSFNPLHDAHRHIYDNIKSDFKFFELSINRVGKENLTLADVCARSKHFLWKYPLLVTATRLFVDKYNLLASLGVSSVFHVGFDTAVRIVKMHPKEDIETWGRYYVYDRDGKNFYDYYDHYDRPNNFIRVEMPKDMHNISSTSLRK